MGNSFINKIKVITMRLLFCFFGICKIKKKKIVASNFNGRGYGDSGKYIAEELLKDNEANYDFVWLIDAPDPNMPNKIRMVKNKSLRAVYELATAKVWIDNRRKPLYTRKRNGQFYIQTWHGMAIKKVEKDAASSLSQGYIEAAKHDSKMADVFLAADEFNRNLYRSAFWYEGEILNCGLPRHDILFQNDENLIASVKRKLGIDTDVNIVMYAPTFRKNTKSDLKALFHINWDHVIEVLSKRFGSSWLVLLRLHPNIVIDIPSGSLNHSVLDVSGYPDMQELLLISNCVITDYSSSLVEFAMTGKMGFIFATDIEEYISERGSYFNLYELPFSVATSEEELLKNIFEFKDTDYRNAIDVFYHKKLGIYPAGNASQYVADLIKRICD